MVIDLDCRTIQGSILGTLLYAIYILPLFNISQLTNFSDGIEYKNQMKVLGVIFDTKLQLAPQITQTITKAKVALHSIKLIKPSFNQDEIKYILTANYVSILYYNLEIWHISSLNVYLK